MQARIARRPGLVAALALACACGSGRTAPTGPATQTVTSVTVAGDATGPRFQCVATAHFSDGSGRDVTNESTWESSMPSIATVSAQGLVSVVAAGTVDIRATFRQTTGSFRFAANPPAHTLSGVVRDSSNGRSVAGALVQIVDGANDGRRSTTDGDGFFSIDNLLPATLTLRVSHERYQTTDTAVAFDADTRVEIDVRPSTPTIVITAQGVDTKVLTVWVGAQVTFVNADGQVHRMFSDPHPVHTDCPPLNEVGFLSPGAARTTGPLVLARTCGFHDHGEPDNATLKGVIIIR